MRGAVTVAGVDDAAEDKLILHEAEGLQGCPPLEAPEALFHGAKGALHILPGCSQDTSMRIKHGDGWCLAWSNEALPTQASAIACSISGFSVSRLRNMSAVMRMTISSPRAHRVAVRVAFMKMAISPNSSFWDRVLTARIPSSVSSMMSTSPDMMT